MFKTNPELRRGVKVYYKLQEEERKKLFVVSINELKLRSIIPFRKWYCKIKYNKTKQTRKTVPVI